MTKEQFSKLVELIEAIIDEKRPDSDGNDLLWRNKVEAEALALFVTGEKDD